MKRSAAALVAVVLTLIALIASGAFAEDPHVERPKAGAPEVTTAAPTEDLSTGLLAAQGYVEHVVTYVTAVHDAEVAAYVDAVTRSQVEAYLVANAPPPPLPVVQPTYPPAVTQSAPSTSTVSGACGGATNGADQYIQRESGGDPNALNPSGAWGCYQLMPEHFAPGGSCDDMPYGTATPAQQAECASRLPLSAWAL